jgi:hypothetical protein
MHALSRGEFLRRGALVAASSGALGLVDARTAFGRAAGDPNPIPGGLDENFTPVTHDPFIHVLPPGIGNEMATITDFKGVVGGSEIRGVAHGSDGTSWDFDTDMRFMQGTFVDVDGRLRTGAFGFV